ncbi:MAG: glycerol-3-phosphate acyltransferase, partial [Caulobacter sp.]
LAALSAAALAAPFALATDRPYPMLGLCLFMAVQIYIRHKDNIRRLLKGEEPRIGKKKTAEAPPPEA